MKLKRNKKLAINRKARFDYEIIKRYEAGLVLKGQEVKSVREGRMSLKGSFVTLHNGELYLTNANIPVYQYAGKIDDYDSSGSRKLLLKKNEIKSLQGKLKIKGLTMVPLSVYNKKSRIKLEFALAKGKREIDKRETIKKRESDKKMERAMKQKY